MKKYKIINVDYLTGLVYTSARLGYKYRECRYYGLTEIHYFIT